MDPDARNIPISLSNLHTRPEQTLVTMHSLEGPSQADLGLDEMREGRSQNKHMQKESMDVF